MLHHGGRLSAAAAQYKIPLEHWLDLSTGINLSAWPVPAIPADCWLRLPEDEDHLEAAACAYYGVEKLLPIAGSQAAIQAIPQLRESCRVAVLSPAYAEHLAAWQRAGHNTIEISAQDIDNQIESIDVLVLVNPCNPSGQRFAPEQLLHWHQQLAKRGGWLVVDEAFMDVTPAESVCAHAQQTGLIVLRSLGKFFGMAGARVGFVCAEAGLLAQLQELLGPWTINAPARWAATLALQDTTWQKQTRVRLLQDETRMVQLLAQHGLAPSGGSALFQWHCSAHAAELQQALAQQAVFTRLFAQPAAIRFGLPATEAQWTQLSTALGAI